MKDAITAFTAGKKWYWYAPLWLFGLYIFVSILGFQPNQPATFAVGFMYTVIFGVHEIAHLATAFFPPIITAASGSIAELLLTGTFVAVALFRRYFFAASLLLMWAMLAHISAGIYMGDARSQQLQLVGFGDTVKHDWAFVFSQLDILSADTFIGTSLRVVGITLGIVGLLGGLWLIYKIATQAREAPAEPSPQTTPGAGADPSAALAAAREAELSQEAEPRPR